MSIGSDERDDVRLDVDMMPDLMSDPDGYVGRLSVLDLVYSAPLPGTLVAEWQ